MTQHPESPLSLESMVRLIKSRRSIRRYQKREVELDLVLKAIDIAAWAPSSGGFQGWMFHVVCKESVIHQICDAVEQKTEIMADWPEADAFREAIERWRRNDGFFREAPLCIAVTMFDYRSAADKVMQARGESDPIALEMIESRRLGSSRLQGVAGAIAYLLLLLHQMGLGSCWMAGPLQAKREIEQILEIPSDQQFVALLPVGWPAEEPAIRPHKSLEQMVRII